MEENKTNSKFISFIKNKYVIYGLICFAYLIGVVVANILDFLLVDAGECFLVAWNILSAWFVITLYKKKWLVQIDKTSFFNLYLLLGLLVIFVNLLRFLGPTDFHAPVHQYLIAFISTFSIALAEQSIFKALTFETFNNENNTFKGYKLIIVVAIFAFFTFLKDFLSSFFINLIDINTDVFTLMEQSIFWKPIINNIILSICFGFFLFAIYRRTNLSTVVAIQFGYFLIQEMFTLSVSATYLPDTVSIVIYILNLLVMVSSGLFFSLYKKKLPQNLEYEVISDKKD